MPYNKIHNLYQIYHDQVQFKKNACVQKINQLKSDVAGYRAQRAALALSLSSQWQQLDGQALSREAIFVIKRKEALLLANYNRIGLIIEELKEIIISSEAEMADLNKVQIGYAKKKEKWSFLNKEVKRVKKRKVMSREELHINESLTCRMELLR